MADNKSGQQALEAKLAKLREENDKLKYRIKVLEKALEENDKSDKQ